MSTRGPIVEQWIAQTIQSYPSAAVAFLSGESDPFRNPVGHTAINVFFVLVEVFTVFYSRMPADMEHFQYLFYGIGR